MYGLVLARRGLLGMRFWVRGLEFKASTSHLEHQLLRAEIHEATPPKDLGEGRRSVTLPTNIKGPFLKILNVKTKESSGLYNPEP